MFGSLFPVCFVASPAKVATVRLGTIIIVRRKSIRCSASSSSFHAGPAHLFGLAFFKYISIQIFFFFLIKRSRKSCLNPIGRLVFLSSGLREISQSRCRAGILSTDCYNTSRAVHRYFFIGQARGST